MRSDYESAIVVVTIEESDLGAFPCVHSSCAALILLRLFILRLEVVREFLPSKLKCPKGVPGFFKNPRRSLSIEKIIFLDSSISVIRGPRRASVWIKKLSAKLGFFKGCVIQRMRSIMSSSSVCILSAMFFVRLYNAVQFSDARYLLRNVCRRSISAHRLFDRQQNDIAFEPCFRIWDAIPLRCNVKFRARQRHSLWRRGRRHSLYEQSAWPVKYIFTSGQPDVFSVWVAGVRGSVREHQSNLPT